MENEQAQKKPKVASKSFMTVGPTLHYSHKNVQRCWLLAVVAYGVTCFFWSKIVTGRFWSFDFEAVTHPEFWRLGKSLVTGVSIFEHPWQILVLGLLMGTLAIVPVLMSQLMSFSYSLLFILEVIFFGNLQGFAICLLASCFAAACRPLRFRSRFIAIALCTAPQLLYWGCFGGARGVEPIEWGFSFAPWICAWIIALGIAALVLGIGHYTRYRPGLVWIFTFVFLLLAIATFEIQIGFDELDYQLYVAKNNPEHVSEFHDHSITEALNETTNDPVIKKYLEGFFYPADQIARRQELKREIEIALSYYDHWPSWFLVPQELNYQTKKQWLLAQYDSFISRRFKSNRMPIALYYKAILSEYSPDIMMLRQKEILHFYSDYPYERSREIWYRLYSKFGSSPESLEARWRIAKHWAGQGKFEQAAQLLSEAQNMAVEQLKLFQKQQTQTDTLLKLFQPPADSAMTEFKLTELQRRLNQLRTLIGAENRTGKPDSTERLARFVMLNPHASDYAHQLSRLLEQTAKNDPLYDNIVLDQAKLVADEQLRTERLSELHKEFPETDGGMQALYELGLLKISLWRQQDDSNLELKKKFLTQARTTLERFISLYPDSFCAEQAKKNLDGLPTN